MVKKTENLIGDLDFRPVNTFERFRNEKSDFGKTMQAATRASGQSDLVPRSTEKTAQRTEAEKQSSPTGKAKEVDGALERMNQSPKKDLVQAETEEMPAEDVMAVLQTVIAEVKQQFMDVFGVTEEEFTAAMEKLGLTEEDLSDPEMLTKLAAELLGTEDRMELLFHPEVTELIKTVQDKFAEVSEELEKAGMDLNQVLSVLKEASVHTAETENSVIAGQEPAATQQEGTQKEKEMVTVELASETQAAEKETVQVTEKSSGKQEKNLSGEPQNFSAQILSQLEEAVDERMPEIDARDVVRQVIEEIRLTVKADTTSFEMQLNPEHLGKINLQVAAKNGVVTAQIATETLEAKEILEAQLTTLKETLEHQGVKVEAVEVSIGARSFDQNLDDQAKNNNQETGQEKPKRLRFDMMEADEEELTSAEQIAREIMMANGNRIDYSA